MTIQRMKVSHEEHNAFVKKHPNGSLTQLTQWGDLKELNNWYYHVVTVGDGEKITGSTMLMFKKIPKLPMTFCYANSGFVLDWEDKETAEALTREATEVAKKENAILIRMDPDVTADDQKAMETATSLGFRHKGFDLGLYAYTQPRIRMVTDISPPLKDVMKTFQSRTRTNVRKSLKNGLVMEDAPLEKMKIFHELMQVTGDRDEFSIRGLDYFETMYRVLYKEGDIHLFLVKLDPFEAEKALEKDIQNKEKEIERLKKKEQDKGIRMQIEQMSRSVENTEKQLEDMRRLQETDPEGKYLSGAILTLCGTKASYLYGASSNAYRDLLPNYFMQWKMMECAKEKGATSYDFGGVTGKEDREDDEAPGLYEFKKRWGTKKVEGIGEFDLVLKPFWYRLMEWALYLDKKRSIKKIGVEI